jgi:hypothetical protein
VGIWFIILIYLERINSNENNEFYWMILILTSFFLVTVKISALPIAIIAFLYLIESESSILKKILLIFCSGLFIFSPFIIRNYIISGYMIYPYPAINLFNPDWKIPVSYVNEMKSVITTHAQAGDWQIRPFSEWLPLWFFNLSAGFRILSVFILLSPILILTIIFVRRNILKIFKAEFKVLVICFLAILFWFFSAPNYRFIYGFLFIYILLTGIILIHFLLFEIRFFKSFQTGREKLLKFFCEKMLVVLIILFPFFFISKFDFVEIHKSILFPLEYKEASVKSVTINNIQVNIPIDNKYCWNATIPCSIIQNNIGITNVELRGDKLVDGFRVRK